MGALQATTKSLSSLFRTILQQTVSYIIHTIIAPLTRSCILKQLKNEQEYDGKIVYLFFLYVRRCVLE